MSLIIICGHGYRTWNLYQMLPRPSIPSLKRLPLWHWNVRYAKMAALNYYTIKILIHLVINACKKIYYRLHVRIRTIAWKISNVDVRHMMRQAKLFMGSFGMVLFWYFANLHCPLRLCLSMIFWQCTEVQNDWFSSSEFYQLDLNGNGLFEIKTISLCPKEPNFLQ